MYFTLKQPDDWHCHFRDEQYLARTVMDCAKQFHRAIVMPNIKPPVSTIESIIAYKKRILKHVPDNMSFIPLMTLYLTETVSLDTLIQAKKSGIITACKLYPNNVTTHSQDGISDIKKIFSLLDQLQSLEIPLCIHGESSDPLADIFDREKLFLEQSLSVMIKQFPKLRIVLEHISTKTAVDFIIAHQNIAATITPHHLHYNRNDLLKHGIKPHYFCMPILKRKEDQQALIQAAVSGNPKFFLGTDSAPHTKTQKESACGSAGIYSGYAAVSLYAEIFEKANALHRFENFASVFGAEFYQLPVNQNQITLIKKPWKMPEFLTFGSDQLIPMKAGETISWQIQSP